MIFVGDISFDSKKILGVIIIIIGILGIIIPLLPGIPIIILGCSILGWESLKEKVKFLRERIQNNNIEKKSSLLIRLYLVPLEWILLFEKNKIKKAIEEIKNKKHEK